MTTGQIAEAVGAELIGSPDISINRLDAADRASEGTLTFLRSTKYAAAWNNGTASAVLVARDVPLNMVLEDVDAKRPAPGRAVLVVADADAAMIKALNLFAPAPTPPATGAHPSAVIDATARVDPAASIGPNCTVGAGAEVRAGAVLVGNVFVGRGARVGEGSVLHPCVAVLERCEMGRGCILHSGVIIGADGFGYHPSPDGRGLVKIPHIGNVVIDDGVEIGANTCIDRGKFGSTMVGAGTKIDNLVQVGHNCRIGRCCIICGNVGLSGSITIGDGVMIGGGVGIADNLEVGSGARIGAYAGVINNVPAGQTYLGTPAGPVSEWKRIYAFIRRVGRKRAAEI